MPIGEEFFDRQIKNEMREIRVKFGKMERMNILEVSGWSGKMLSNFMSGKMDNILTYRQYLVLQRVVNYMSISNPKVINPKKHYGKKGDHKTVNRP